MTFHDAILEQEAKRIFPEQFCAMKSCDCPEDEPDICPDNHLHCSYCHQLFMEVRL